MRTSSAMAVRIVLLMAALVASGQAAQTIFSPLVNPAKGIYPVVILSSIAIDQGNLNHPLLLAAQAWSPQGVGDPRRFIGVRLTGITGTHRVIVVVRSMDSVVLESSEYQGDLTLTGDTCIYPRLAWNYQALAAKNTEARPTTLAFSVAVDGEALPAQTAVAMVYPINRCPFVVEDHDLKWIFAAYVDENHPRILSLLTEAKNIARNTGYEVEFCGMQQPGKNVMRQIACIWLALRQAHLAYLNITTTGTLGIGVTEQHVRTIDEIFADQAMNCVEASVVLASAAQKLGIPSALVIAPGHMYFAFNSAGRAGVCRVESTLMGAPQRAEARLEDELSGFIKAANVGESNETSALLSVQDLRSMGVTPAFSQGSLEEALRVKATEQQRRDTIKTTVVTAVAAAREAYEKGTDVVVILAQLTSLREDAARGECLGLVDGAQTEIQARQVAKDRPRLEAAYQAELATCRGVVDANDMPAYTESILRLRAMAPPLGHKPEVEALAAAWVVKRQQIVEKLSQGTVAALIKAYQALPAPDSATGAHMVEGDALAKQAKQLASELAPGAVQAQLNGLVERHASNRLKFAQRVLADIEALERRLESRPRTGVAVGEVRAAYQRIGEMRIAHPRYRALGAKIDTVVKAYRSLVTNLSSSGAHLQAVREIAGYAKANVVDPEVDAMHEAALHAAIDAARGFPAQRKAEAREIHTLIVGATRAPGILTDAKNLE